MICASSIAAVAQAAEEIGMADTFRAEGKIYVVVAVILLIFAGMVVYMFNIDRKLSRLEKELDK
ncbi:CcmD family protein [Porifericola rhodea]|uniref:CcmD family protein n=1 Tax=Porifericola rhodea TaxID=930972 RepID=UPI00266603EF|nr:CcmD family protein [Porifericola rhodea]WKN32878.1 CcmD family protein [Porifericola rhodea]